jgi:hypothetical protein
MTLGNMRQTGVHHLIAYCLNGACRHQALIDVSGYPDNVEIRSWRGASAASVVAVASMCGPPGKRDRARLTIGVTARPGMSDAEIRLSFVTSMSCARVPADRKLKYPRLHQLQARTEDLLA